jgi:amidophosphoribosyltransferase
MCGVVGLSLKRDTKAFADWNAGELAVQLLVRIQHRGQDGAGITVFSRDKNFHTVKGLGLIEAALKDRSALPANSVAVAHTRYATTGTGGVAEVQPFVSGAPKVAMAHNGNIVNCEELIQKFGLTVTNESDLEVLQQIFLRAKNEKGFQHAVQVIFNEFNGSYAVVGVDDEGGLFAFRDPFGIRPLFLGQSDDCVVFASETSALSPLGPDLRVSEVQPGEWVYYKDSKLERGIFESKRNPKKLKRFCMFENVYFSSAQSEMHQSSVYRLRFRLGEVLAREIVEEQGSIERVKEMVDFVVPVPDTSRTAALAVAETLSLPYREFLVKNNYVPRTFILGRQEARLKALTNKLSLIGPEIKGNRVLLVDDSVVRGNTSRMMALRLREAGAKSIFLASTCPPIRHGCFYGIDFPDPDELVATKRSVPEICTALGVDHLHYISTEGLKSSFGGSDFCLACLNGDYPTKDASFVKFLESRRQQRGYKEVTV